MSILSGVSSFFGLDIGVTAVRLVELNTSGKIHTLARYAYVPIDIKMALSDAKSDQLKLAQIVATLVSESKVDTKNVAVGIPSNRVFTTVADFDRLPESELGKAIYYQADSLIPTSPAESKIDWALIGDSPKDKTKLEVLLTSVPNKYVEERLDLVESIGLNVIAFEPDNLALVRSLVPAEATLPQMVVNIGQMSTDLVITLNGIPRLARSIPTGIDAIVRAAQQNLNVDDRQAQQFVFKFGVSREKLEGQIYQAIITTLELIVAEIDKSIKFFQSRYPEAKLDHISVTGGASTIPEFPLYLANKFGINIEIGNAWRDVAFSADRQNELLAISSQFGVAVGLAERNA